MSEDKSQKVINMFSRKAEKDPPKEESLDLEEIQKANAAKAEKLAKERKQHNQRVTREFQLTKK